MNITKNVFGNMSTSNWHKPFYSFSCQNFHLQVFRILLGGHSIKNSEVPTDRRCPVLTQHKPYKPYDTSYCFTQKRTQMTLL